SSAKPLPDPDQGYEPNRAAISPGDNQDDDRPKNRLTNKEDSICFPLPCFWPPLVIRPANG
ncbi:MAG: hypothetical protein ACRD29_00205, partial [Acidimicrobiales bacterium]